MKKKSALAMAVLAAGVLVSLLLPSQAAASCTCLSDRFNGSGSAIGGTCSEAQNNLTSSLSSAANQSCQFRGYASACNIVIRTGTCNSNPDPNFPFRVDGTVKYSCLSCVAP